jgi:heptosyltransferase-1
MQRILLVKTTSLGDVIHCLPAVTDIHALFPAAKIDWVVEETYVDVVGLHPAVTRVLPVAVRRWRRHLFKRETRDEVAAFRASLDAQGYDRVIDVQGLAKSALLACMARGERHGLDRASAREWIASFAYAHRHAVPWTLDAVARNRTLVGAALGYLPRGAPDYGIAAPMAKVDWLPDGPYCICLTGTTDAAKLWPEDRWARLLALCADVGLLCVLPTGTESEFKRAERIVAASGVAAILAPPQTLKQMAGVLAGARLAVGVDTGLTHLAGALSRPTVGIYCSTSPARTGVIAPLGVNVGEVARTPTPEDVWEAARSLLGSAPCRQVPAP